MIEQNRALEAKIDSLESISRILELRAKNSTDHGFFLHSYFRLVVSNLATRMEEREVDQKQEYEKLHERYNDLLRTHIDHVERTKFLMGAENFDMANILPKRFSYFYHFSIFNHTFEGLMESQWL